MNKFLLFLVLSILINNSLSAQTLRGKVLDTKNNPVPNATIYIKENTSGIMADENGIFKTSLQAGEYTIQFRSVGYETLTKKVTVPIQGAEIQANMREKPIQLNEVIVNPAKEDPAYQIMRNVIAKAPYHLHQLSSYTSEVYMKGSGKLEKISGLVKMAMNDKNMEKLIGKLLVFESKNIVNYTIPNKYKQKVIAYKSSFPKEFEPKNGISVSTSSIYFSYFLGKVSPLSTQAFQYYKFKFEDAFQSGNNQIYKIRFFPKLKSRQLSSGILYIIDNEWSIYSAEFDIFDLGMKSHTKINYQEVYPNVFLPITYEQSSSINLLGIKANSRFFTSTKYSNVRINVNAINAKSDKSIIAKKENLSKTEQKALLELEKLSEKEKITTGDALKIAKLSTVLNNKPDTARRKKSLELKPYKSPVDLEKDSLANNRDSIYWDSIRTVPLQKEEQISYQFKDSFPKFDNVKRTDNEISVEAKTHSKLSWLIGGKYNLSKSSSIYFDGLLAGNFLEYNLVDGFWLGQKVGMDIKTTENTKFNFEPSFHYTTARKSAIWQINISQSYAPMKNGLLWISFGNTSQDIMQNKGTSRIFNSAAVLWNGTNAISFYQKKHISAENSIDIANGLKFKLGGSYENRTLLENNTEFNFLNKSVKPNFPREKLSEFPNHTSTLFWTGLEWTPKYYYRIVEGKKYYSFSRYPTFQLLYTKAVPALKNETQPEYDKINFSVQQEIRLGLFDMLRYNINLGGFLTKKQLFAPDYQYFSTIPLYITHHKHTETFALLPNYTYLNDKWWESHITFSSEHILLKRIPALQSKAFSESLHFNTLWNYKGKPYNELGYSIGFTPDMRIGVYSSFTGINYNNIGIRINLSLFEK
ncbi:conserved exported hypothetical protein [uncultured Paludibacter sp.]|nr:conserved exported hypothetical protein [uncultured Paludibacter sp.]